VTIAEGILIRQIAEEDKTEEPLFMEKRGSDEREP
jgi:hypothetical protein